MVNYTETVYDILSNYIQYRYEELYYGTEKTFDEFLFAYENDYTPDIYFDVTNTDFIPKPNTVSSTITNDQIYALLDKFTIAVQYGNITALQYANELVKAIKESNISPNVQNAIYEYVIDRLSLFIEPLNEELRNEIFERNNVILLQKYYSLSILVSIDLVIKYIATIQMLLMQIFDKELTENDILAQIITDISVYLASKFVEDPNTEFQRLLLWYKTTDIDVIDYVHMYILNNYTVTIDAYVELINKDADKYTQEELQFVALVDNILQNIQQYLEPIDLTDTDMLTEFLSSISDAFNEYYESLKETEQPEYKFLSFESYSNMYSTYHLYTEATQGYVTEFTIHEHKADRAGLHYDLRIRVGQKVMSIAFRKPIVALEKGEKRQGFIQPIHTKKWLSFQGEIKEGYGKGTIKIIAKGQVTIYKTGRDNIVMQFNDFINNKEYWYAFIITDKDRNDKYHPVLIIPVDSKKESEHLRKPSINEILTYFGYVPGSDLMNVYVDV